MFTNPHRRANRGGGHFTMPIQPMTQFDFDQAGGDGQIAATEAGYAQNPGTAPGGTGGTGLLSNDATGWSRMLNAQAKHQQMTNFRRQNPGGASPAIDGLQSAVRRRY
jgi:hypothetical protein